MAHHSVLDVITADGVMPAHLVRPAAGTGPGLVLFQEIFGVSDYILQRATDLAGLGYVVVVPELYWRLPDATLDPGRGNLLDQAMALASALEWDTTVADGAATVAAAAALPQVQGVPGLFGFCFGGGVAFAVAARTDPALLVSYYGSALPNLLSLAPAVTCPSLHHFGTADAYIPPDQQDAIAAAVTDGPDHRFESYPGAGHAFDNPDPQFHHRDAATTAWAISAAFLSEHLATH